MRTRGCEARAVDRGSGSCWRLARCSPQTLPFQDRTPDCHPCWLILLIAAVQLFVRLFYVPRRFRRGLQSTAQSPAPFESVCTIAVSSRATPPAPTAALESSDSLERKGPRYSCIPVRSDLHIGPKRLFPGGRTRIDAFRSSSPSGGTAAHRESHPQRDQMRPSRLSHPVGRAEPRGSRHRGHTRSPARFALGGVRPLTTFIPDPPRHRVFIARQRSFHGEWMRTTGAARRDPRTIHGPPAWRSVRGPHTMVATSGNDSAGVMFDRPRSRLLRPHPRRRGRPTRSSTNRRRTASSHSTVTLTYLRS